MQSGYVIFIAALGMMFSLIAVDISNLQSWTDATAPIFVGKVLAHFGAVIAAFIGGKLIPTDK